MMNSKHQRSSSEPPCNVQLVKRLKLDEKLSKISEQISSLQSQLKRISEAVTKDAGNEKLRLTATKVITTERAKTKTVVESRQSSLLLLPDELLEIILGKVKDPGDLLSCSRICTKFRNLLEPSICVWLFPLILPHVFNYLEKDDVLNIREVCHEWKTTVDNFIESSVAHVDPVAFIQPYKTALPRTIHWQDDLILEFHTDLESSEDFSMFIAEMDGKRPFDNPFVGRSVCFTRMIRTPEYWQEAVNFLEKFGKHIWELGLHLFDEDIRDASVGAGFIKAFSQILIRLPNLKKLRICGDFDPNVWNDSLNVIRELIQQEPVPSSPHLVSIELDNMDHLNEGHMLFPKSYWQQLQQLFIKSSEFDCLIHADTMHETGLENLKKLMLRVDLHWSDFSKLQRLRSPLKTLKIAFDTIRIDINKLLRVLQHFGQTLEHVQVEWSKQYVLERSQNQALEYAEHCKSLSIPNLKIIELWDPLDSLNFLSRLVSVQFITIVTTRGKRFARGKYINKPRGNEVEGVGVYGYVNRMYESNIWELLPSLQIFKFRMRREFRRNGDTDWTWKWKTRQYTRQGYNEFQRQGSNE